MLPGVEIYKYPIDDETVSEINSQMNTQMPFAVLGSREEVLINGETFRARQYPWGTVLVENENHCDFVKLREMLLRTNMQVRVVLFIHPYCLRISGYPIDIVIYFIITL